MAPSLSDEKRSVACRTIETAALGAQAEQLQIFLVQVHDPGTVPGHAADRSRPQDRPYPPPTSPSPIPPPVSESGPPSWRRQHGHVEAPNIDASEFRPFWRARSQLDKLVARDLITGMQWQWQAANTFRLIYEKAHQGELGTRDLSEGIYIDRNCRRRGSGEPDQQRLVALARLQRVKRELGDVSYRIITWLAVEDFSWAEIGRRLKVDPKTARAWSLIALRSLPAP